MPRRALNLLLAGLLGTACVLAQAANSPPIIFGGPSSFNVNEDTNFVIAGVNVTDPDNTTLQMAISTTNGGTITLPTVVGLAFSSGANGTASMVFTGTLTNINNAIGSMTYRSALNYNGGDSVNLLADDLSGGTGPKAIGVTVDPVNDAPTIMGLATQRAPQNTVAGPYAFTVADIEQAAGTILVTATTSNTTLVQSIVINGNGGPDGSRTITITPNLNQFGTAIIQVTADDGVSGVTTVPFNMIFSNPPTITPLLDQATSEETQTVPQPFTIGDTETPAGSLTVTATSSNTTLIPNGSITITALGGGNKDVRVSPVLNLTGTATITVAVQDGHGNIIYEPFDVTVMPVNDAPTLNTAGAPAFTPVAEDTPAASIPGNAIAPLLTSAASDVDAGDAVGIVVIAIDAANGVWEWSPDGTPGSFLAISNAPPVSDANAFHLAPTAFIRFVPNPDFFGSSLLIYRAWDQSNLVVSGTFAPIGGTGGATAYSNNAEIASISITSVNDAPTILPLPLPDDTIDENQTSIRPFTVSDLETAVGSLLITATSTNQMLVPNGNLRIVGTTGSRLVTATAAANQFGDVIVTVRVDDTSGGVVYNSYNLHVNSINSLPTISPLNDQVTPRATPTLVQPFTVGDADLPPQTLLVWGSSSNTTLIPDASIVISGTNPNRGVQATPAAGQSGAATITVFVSDSIATTTETYDVYVNDPPTISPLSNQTTPENTATAPNPFVINDTEDGPNTLTVTATSSNATLFPLGSFAFGGAGANRDITATPATNQNGSATVTVFVQDSFGAISSANYTINVTPTNNAPTITPLNDQTTPEDTPSAPQNFTIDDVDTPVGNLIVTATSSNQAIVPDGNISIGGSGANRTISATGALNQSGTATIVVLVSDGSGGIVGETFDLTVTPVNDEPTITPLSDVTTVMNTPSQSQNFTIDDVDHPVGTLVVTATSSNQTLIPDANIILSGTPPNGSVYVIPAPGQTGTAQIAVTVTDPNGAGQGQLFNVFVNGSNQPPTITPIVDQLTPEDTPLTVNFTVGDLETALDSLIVTATSSNQTLVPNVNIVPGGSGANRSVTITPAPDQFGVTQVTVQVRDGNFATTSQSFLLTVTPENDAPVVTVPPAQFVNEDALLVFNGVSIADVDLNGGIIQAGVRAQNGVITLATTTGLTFLAGGDGTNVMAFQGTLAQVNAALTTLQYQPLANYNGGDLIEIGARDLGQTGNGGSKDGGATITVTVNPIPDRPQFSSGPTATPNPAVVLQVIDFTVAAGDADNDTLAIVWDFGDGGSDTGGFTTHAYTAAGVYNVTVTATDPGGLTTTNAIAVTVTAAIGVGGGIDSDGDGFSDAIEILAGSSPTDANSTPIGGAGALPAEVLRVDALQIGLNFSRPNSDTLAVAGKVPLPADFPFQGQKVIVDVGGVLRLFTLNQKAQSAPKGNDSMALKIDSKTKMFRFTIKAKKGAFATALADDGLLNESAVKKKVTVPVTLIFGVKVFTQPVEREYNAKVNKTGKTK